MSVGEPVTGLILCCFPASLALRLWNFHLKFISEVKYTAEFGTTNLTVLHLQNILKIILSAYSVPALPSPEGHSSGSITWG